MIATLGFTLGLVTSTFLVGYIHPLKIHSVRSKDIAVYLKSGGDNSSI